MVSKTLTSSILIIQPVPLPHYILNAGASITQYIGATDNQILCYILASHSIRIDFEAVAAWLGPNCTPRAVQERIKKLKKMGIEQAAASGRVMPGVSNPSPGGKPQAAKKQKIDDGKKPVVKKEGKKMTKIKTEVKEEGEEDDAPKGRKRKRADKGYNKEADEGGEDALEAGLGQWTGLIF